jgi:hypothetical protein
MFWWLWIIFGIVLLAGELAAPGGFFLFFFGAGALIVGSVVGFFPGLPQWVQWLIFPLISVGLLVLFRDKVLSYMHPASSSKVDSLVGETAFAIDAIPAGAFGKVELRGSSWSAKNTGSKAIEKGARCKVLQSQDLMVHVAVD